MKIDLKIDADPLNRLMDMGQKKLAYAVVNAIRDTAIKVQQAEFHEVKDSFQIRKPAFFFGTDSRPGGAAAKITTFPSVKQGRPYAEVEVTAPEGRGLVSKRFLLPYFEEGGERPIFTPGAAHVAVPIRGGPARPTWPSSVPQEFTFAGMHLVAFSGGKKVKRAYRRRSRQEQGLWDTSGRSKLPMPGKLQWKGKSRTFIIMSPEEGKSGVYQRTGPKKIRAVYLFEDPKELDSRLNWLYTAQLTADRWFGEEMEAQVIDAIAHSKGKGL